MNIYPWQIDLLDKMTKYKGRGVIQVTGRQTGKSAFSAQAFQRLWDDIHKRPVEDLILTERPVNGARYYCVEPIGGSWLEMETWVQSMCGEPGDMWNSNDWCCPESARWLQNDRKFWFRNEEDRTMFIMRWR